MTRRSPGNGDTKREHPYLSIENLNLREAILQARERTNRERNRVKCKRYYQRRRGKNNPDIVRKDDPKEGVM
jgi:hypothetical protein